MKKFHLFLFLTTGFTCIILCSCNKKPNASCGGTAPIMWGNDNVATFENIELSVSDTYYEFYNPTVLALSPSTPITDFHQALTRPNTQGKVYYNSYVNASTSMREDCFNGDYNLINRNFAGQRYISTSPPHTPYNWGYLGEPLPVAAIDYSKTVPPIFETKRLTVCRATNRNPWVQLVRISVQSGTYTKNDYIYNIVWYKDYNSTTIDAENIVINQGEINLMKVKNLKITGSAINVTPDRPFVTHIYLDGSLKPYTLENVSMPNDMMTLKVK